MKTTKAPPPGIYRDIPQEEYRAWDLPSSTSLKALDGRTPLHARHTLDTERDSPSLRIGRAAHVLILEADQFDRQFTVAPDVDRRTKAGKEEWAAFEATVKPGICILKADEYETATKIAASVLDPGPERMLVHGLLRIASEREISVVGEVAGYRCKARLDAYGSQGGDAIVVDVKTTDDASPFGFERSIARFGYGLQAAIYHRVCVSAGLNVTDFVWIVAEKSEPYGVAVYRMLDEVIELFDRKLPQLLQTWHNCNASGVWPGYSRDIKDIGVPRWLRRELEEGFEGVTR